MSKIEFLGRFKWIDPMIRDEAYHIAIDHASARGRPELLTHPRASKEHVDKALNSEDVYASRSAARHPNISKETLLTALNSDDRFTKSEALNNPNYKTFFPNGH